MTEKQLVKYHKELKTERLYCGGTLKGSKRSYNRANSLARYLYEYNNDKSVF